MTSTQTTTAVPPSAWRAWCYLVRLSCQRQLRSQLTVWFALILLAFTTVSIGLQTARNRWGVDHHRSPRGQGPTYQKLLEYLEEQNLKLPVPGPSVAGPLAVVASFQALTDVSGFLVFSRWIVFSVFLGFLLPIWSLSFATEALGGEREAGSLVWLVSRPLPRSAIYLAKFVALLPWALGLNIGGFVILCLAAGRAGRPALSLYLPAVFWASLAFCALFHLFGALFRRSAIVALVYSFCLEIILGNMPGNMKRLSIGYYARCMMFEQAETIGVHPAKASVFGSVDGTTAWLVLMSATVLLLVAGMIVFARTEYRDVA